MVERTSKILIIEDEEVNLHFLMMVLKSEGYNVFGSLSGSEGIQKALDIIPDLIISDINMPEMNGFHVLQETKLYPEIASIPFIFLSVRGMADEIREGMNLGADDYLVKPVNKEALLNSVESRLRKHKREIINSNIDKNLFRQRIASMLPHEINTPLVGILGGLQILWENYQMLTEDERKDMIEIAYLNALRLDRMRKNYLVYTKIEMSNGDRALYNQLRAGTLCNYNEFFKNILIEQSREQKRDNQWIFEPDKDNISIQISEENFYVIISAIVDNAFRYSNNGDTVRVITLVNTDKQIFTISIIDKGRGMTQFQINEIGAFIQFERIFYEQQGAGLGLVLSKKLTELMDGIFEIVSGENGTRVNISIPLSPN